MPEPTPTHGDHTIKEPRDRLLDELGIIFEPDQERGELTLQFPFKLGSGILEDVKVYQQDASTLISFKLYGGPI